MWMGFFSPRRLTWISPRASDFTVFTLLVLNTSDVFVCVYLHKHSKSPMLRLYNCNQNKNNKGFVVGGEQIYLCALANQRFRGNKIRQV